MLSTVQDGLKDLARQSPIPLPNGKVIRPVTMNRKTFSTDDAIALLQSKGATAEEIDACYRTATVEQIRESKS